MRININGADTDLVGLMQFVGAVAIEPTIWVCQCGMLHRGKDLSCWDVGGCGQTRVEVGMTLWPVLDEFGLMRSEQERLLADLDTPIHSPMLAGWRMGSNGLPERHEIFQIVCSWCKCVMKKGTPGALISHSICPSCSAKLESEV